jgi:hypothetical protein
MELLLNTIEGAHAPAGSPKLSEQLVRRISQASSGSYAVLERVEERDPSEGVGARKSGLRMLRGENGAGVESHS